LSKLAHIQTVSENVYSSENFSDREERMLKYFKEQARLVEYPEYSIEFIKGILNQ
jgi:hypothetical protein